MRNNKTAGCDGLPAEFYIAFWDKLCPILIKVYKRAKEVGQLNKSARRGIISLIPKKDRDPLFVHNWRPLTLLTVDCKILVKALANRLKTVLEVLFGHQQTGYMKGRFIGTNILKMIDILRYLDQENIPALVISVDFEKAFDSIEHNALFETLRYFGFGEEFIAWIWLLFSEFQLCTINGGHISGWFTPERGIHQGCPISGYNFILCVEILVIE